ncbi:hypothetical protein K437DRAFT_210422, partial [Tilletiaria anomala UBC 951]
LAALTPHRASTRRFLTSSAFVATFCAAILTVSVSASTALPCPARAGTAHVSIAAEDEHGQHTHRSVREASAGIGEKVRLTRRGGWIEIE